MLLKKRKFVYALSVTLCFLILIYLFSGVILSSIGRFLVVSEKPVKADAVLVLNTGIEYFPRLIEAADIYNKGFVEKIVINGNRKTDVLREIEKKGFTPCCTWYEEWVRILELYNVPREDIIAVSAEDVYDTITEARFVGEALITKGISELIIVTSKSHTRRGRHIWRSIWADQLSVYMISAKDDPYDPGRWWKSGRQIRWVLSEYGAWVYLFF